MEERLVEGTLRCIARWGVAKTSLDDVAREAGCSRASVYRAFPGGKDALLQAVVAAEVAQLSAAVAGRLSAASTLEDAVVDTITTVVRAVRRHPSLQYVFDYEPELVLPHVAFRRLDSVLALAVEVAAPHLERFVGPVLAAEAAEWMARMIVSHLLCPSDRVDTGDEEAARQLVRTFLLPALAQPLQPTIR